MRRSTIVTTVLLCALVMAQVAHADYDPLASGQTKLLLDKRFSRFLGQAGVKLTASGGAKRKARTIALPVSGGRIDPSTGKGEVEHQGTLTFETKRKRVPLRLITVKTKHQPLVAKVGGSQLKVATSSRISSARHGFSAKFVAPKLRLTAKAATRLNKKLRPKLPFEASQPLGKLVSTPQSRLVTILDQGRATLVFDPAFLAKLDSRFVSLNPIFPAEHSGATFTLPVAAGGAIAPSGAEGTFRSGGALEFLQLGAGQVFWQELWLDLGVRSDSAEVDVEPIPAFPGKMGRVGVLDYGLTAVATDSTARTISISGAPLTLSAGAAATFNEAFAQGEAPAFAAGEAVGVLSFTVQGQ
ncbi:MAG TPA: hypothetical protein VG898_11850 [Solirubrobacterales bacterium]|nr:hypothetical protein [Solirubrobacterales bacterium]